MLAYVGFDVSGEADPLSEDEMEAFAPDVADMIGRVGTVLDYLLTHLNANHEESDIWTFSDEETETLARFYLKRARRIGWMAKVARQVKQIAELGDTGRVAGILGKRLVASPMFVATNGGVKPWVQ